MKNRLIFALIAVMLVAFTFSGCGNKAAGNNIIADTAETATEGQNSNASSTGQMDESNKPSEENSVADSQSITNDGITEAENAGDVSLTEKAGFPLTLTDMLGNKVKLEKKPEKIAVISTGLLKLFNSVGGASICAVEPEEGNDIAAFTKDLPKVGKASSPDIVGILELEPDLVFAEAELQNEAVSMLQKNNIAVIALKLDSKENSEKALKLMKKAAGIN